MCGVARGLCESHGAPLPVFFPLFENIAVAASALLPSCPLKLEARLRIWELDGALLQPAISQPQGGHRTSPHVSDPRQTKRKQDAHMDVHHRYMPRHPASCTHVLYIMYVQTYDCQKVKENLGAWQFYPLYVSGSDRCVGKGSNQ